MRRQGPMVMEGDQWGVLDALLAMAATGQEYCTAKELASAFGYPISYAIDVLRELQTYGIAFYRYGKGWYAGEWLIDYKHHVMGRSFGKCASAMPASAPTSKT